MVDLAEESDGAEGVEEEAPPPPEPETMVLDTNPQQIGRTKSTTGKSGGRASTRKK